MMTLSSVAAQVNCVCFSEEATVIFSGSVDTTVRAWDARSHSQQPIQVSESRGCEKSQSTAYPGE